MATWQDLDRELEAWLAAGRTATLWWRDDDATQPTPALARLLALAARFGQPLHLAVIPAQLETGVAGLLAGRPEVRVLQHGYAHIDHIASAGQGAAELGPGRPKAVLCGELAEGWRRLAAAGLPRLLPVLVPPWNRIASEVVAWLPGLGYRGLCTFGGRAGPEAAPGLLQVDSHCDPIRWKGGPRFCGLEAALEVLVGHLSARRSGRVDANEPSGILTHHLETDEATWAFMEELLARTAGRPGARWIGLETLLQPAGDIHV